jgi:hypothetical protein
LLILLDLLLMLEALILQEVSYVICHEAENQNCPNHCFAGGVAPFGTRDSRLSGANDQGRIKGG